jgi:integrase
MDRLVRARVLLAEAAALGVTIDDLVTAARGAPAPVDPVAAGPMVAAYVEAVAPTFSAGTAATYRSFWRLAVTRLGERPVAAIGPADCRAVVADAVTRARLRPGCDGRSSEEACVTALRALFGRAELDGLVVRSPAVGLVKPARRASRRRPLDDTETRELIDAVRATSRDPDLDLLLVRFHLESGARREGALGLRLGDLDRRRSTAWLREKLAAEREQPLAPSLLDALMSHAVDRGSTTADDHVFRTAVGRPISRRHYNTVFDRARTAVGWAGRIPVSAHTLRHTAITATARVAGYPVAQAFAGHAPPSVTGTYMRVSIGEVAAAVAVLTDEPHPVCPPELVATAARRPRCPALRRAEAGSRAAVGWRPWGRAGRLWRHPRPATRIGLQVERCRRVGCDRTGPGDRRVGCHEVETASCGPTCSCLGRGHRAGASGGGLCSGAEIGSSYHHVTEELGGGWWRRVRRAAGARWKRTPSLPIAIPDEDVIEWLGSEQLAYVPFDAPEEVRRILGDIANELDSETIRTQLVVPLDAETRLSERQQAELWLHPSQMWLFDPETGNNLTHRHGVGTRQTRVLAQLARHGGDTLRLYVSPGSDRRTGSLGRAR